MMWLIYFLFISFIFSSNDIGGSTEATEDPEMLLALRDSIIEAIESQNITQGAQDREGRSLFRKKNIQIKSLEENYAKNFLKYAAASYCPQNTIENWSCNNCNGYGANTKDIVYFNNKTLESAAFMGVNHDHKRIVISFRGTDDIKNWKTNAKFSLVPFRTVSGITLYVHNGFNMLVDSHLPNIRSALLKAKEQNPGYSVVFTGHSLGGALATLSAVKLADKSIVEWDKIELITFGQPRVGDRGFADYLNSKPVKSARVTTKHDIVPIVPILYRGTKYHHSLYNIHMRLDGSRISCLNSLDLRCYFSLHKRSIEAHSTFWNQKMNNDCLGPNEKPPKNDKFEKLFNALIAIIKPPTSPPSN